MYWAFAVLTTVGFGDISGYTEKEMLLCILWMLIGIGFYSFLVSTLAAVLSSLDAKKLSAKETVKSIEDFAKLVALPRELVKQLKDHSSAQLETEQMEESRRMKVLASLPKRLRAEVCRAMNGNAARRIKFFKDRDDVFLMNIVPRLELSLCEGGKVLYRKHDHPESVYFIVHGKVNFRLEKPDLTFKQMPADSYFGEIELIEDTLRLFTAETESHCKLLVMRRHLFNELMTNFEHAAQDMKETAKAKKNRDLEAQRELFELLGTITLENRNPASLAGTLPKSHRHSGAKVTTHFPIKGSSMKDSDITPAKLQLNQLVTDISNLLKSFKTGADKY